ncbi:hypothetical protein [Modestobacter sp. NPDC049651]|uniref:hypothetical protein n=1 Tax=unclassified Modestobacter TaxID=2643866 RepID=UPI0033D54636
MQISKQRVLELLLATSQQTAVADADQELPDPVDTDEHAELLRRLGLDPGEVAAEVADGRPGAEVEGLLDS